MIYAGKVSKELSDYIEDTILSSNTIRWVFCAETSTYSEDNSSFITENTLDTFQFEHRIISAKYGVVDPELLSTILSPLVDEYQKNWTNYPCLINISRAKINILTQNSLSKDLYHTPHIDEDIKHWVMVYYINDTDGDTYIFNETCDGTEKQLTINRCISPEKGKFVVFNGKYFHSSSSPKKSTIRSVININFQ
jgi:hypothetical protein